MTWLYIWLGVGAYITIAIIVYALFYKFDGDTWDRDELVAFSLLWGLTLPFFLIFSIPMTFEWLVGKIEEEIDKNDEQGNSQNNV